MSMASLSAYLVFRVVLYLELASPLQVTHLPPVWDLLLPQAETPDRRDHRFTVSSERRAL